MDRAHRLGQKRTVNVYRLLMRGTLEERIMGLQRFKLDLAAAVVNQDNVSLKAMDTSQLLDLFAIKPVAQGSMPAGGNCPMSFPLFCHFLVVCTYWCCIVTFNRVPSCLCCSFPHILL